MEAYSICDYFVVVSKRYLGCFSVKPDGGFERRYLSQKWFLCYHLTHSLKIFINVFAFLNVEVNFKHIYNYNP